MFGGQLLQLIGEALQHEWDCSGQVDNGAKGPVFEQLIAMSLIIRSIRAPPGDLQLADLLQSMGVLPEAFDSKVLANCPVRISGAVNAAGNERVFHELLDGTLPEGTLAYNIHSNAGANLAFCTAAGVDGSPPRRLVLIQAKAQAITSLHDMVRAATPAWQFHAEVVTRMRARAAGGTVAAESCALRAQFLATVQEYPFAMENAIRVVFASAPYQPQTVKLVNGINRLPGYRDSPLCLCMSSKPAFGKCHTRLQRLSGGAPVAHPQCYRMLPPYNVLAHWGNINSIPLVVDLAKWRSKIEALSRDPSFELTADEDRAWSTAVQGAA